jgi:hypothetical protein
LLFCPIFLFFKKRALRWRLSALNAF